MRIQRLPTPAAFVAACLFVHPLAQPTFAIAADEVEQWQTYLAGKEADGFSGAVLVGQADRILLNKEYGAAAKDGRGTTFWIASISKPITAVAVMKLAEDGRVDLNAPVSKYLDGVPAPVAELTLHQLLSHRSGLPTDHTADALVDRGDAIRALGSLRLARKPGEFGYSNDGYNLAAILIEVTSGGRSKGTSATRSSSPPA